MIITPNGHGLGRIPDLTDIRDITFSVEHSVALPSSFDLRDDTMPAIGDQLRLGSCTAWASVDAFRHQLMQQELPDLDGSKLAHYYWTRQIEHTTRYDSEASIKDAIKTLAKRGVAPSEMWPYDITKFKVAPSRKVSMTAKAHEAIEYQSVPLVLDAIKTAIASRYIVVIGISVYQSFESDEANKTGMIPMPQPHEDLLGGHAMGLCGFNDNIRYFATRNQWGQDWGDKGYCYIPYDYITNPKLGGDYWVIKVVK